jgi:glutathione S-transferase
MSVSEPAQRARLYWTAVSHPSQAVRKMLELKGVDYRLVNVLPLTQRLHLRLAGFRGGTVPAFKVNGRRVQGSRQIAHELDELWPEPALFPADPHLRARVEEAERWGEQQLQPVPRRIGRFGAARKTEVRRWGARAHNVPLPDLVALASGPVATYYARTIEADGRRVTKAAVRADLEALPELLGHAERLLEDGTLATDPANAATLQVLSSVRLLDCYSDLHDHIGQSPCARVARELFPDYPGPMPAFLPTEWLEPLARAYGNK